MSNHAPSRSWPPRLKWFAAEFIVVVSGILAALIIQAAWQQRQDGAKQSAYLNQLLADLTVTKARIAHADSAQAAFANAQQEIMEAYHTSEPPRMDSLAKLLRDAIRIPRSPIPVLGTIDALVSTGDMRLIRDDSLRAAILNYSSVMRSEVESLAHYTVESVLGLRYEIAQRIDMDELEARYNSQVQVDSARVSSRTVDMAPRRRRERFPLTEEGILNDRTLYAALTQVGRMKVNIRVARRTMSEETERLERQIRNNRK